MPTRREIRAKDKRLAEALGRRLAELRREVGFTQAQVARLMGRRGKGSGNLVSRLEKGGVERPTLALVADYLRAIRRSIRDVAGVIDEHTSKPWMPDERVEKAITKLKLPKEVEDRVVRYDVKTEMDRRYSRGRKTEVNETERVKRAQNLALALMQQEKLEAWMNEVLPEIEGYTRSKAVLKRHGRRVWGILKRTRPMTEEDRILPDKRRRRAALLAAALDKETGKKGVSRRGLEQMQEQVAELFRYMEQTGQLDHLPSSSRRRQKRPGAVRKGSDGRRAGADEKVAKRELVLQAIALEVNRELEQEKMPDERRVRYFQWLRYPYAVLVETMDKPEERTRRLGELVAQTGSPGEARQVCEKLRRWFEKYVRRQLRREHLEAIAFNVLGVVPAKEPKLPDPTDPFGFKAASARAERLGRR